MALIEILAGVVLAYIIGSIPTSVLISKIHFGLDIRDHGTGEATHTNVLSVLGWKASWIVRLIDILKGFAAVSVFCLFQQAWYADGPEAMQVMRMSFGLAVILGHIFPVWAKFRGGKGVYVATGVLLTLLPQALVFCFLVSLACWLITQRTHFAYLMGSAALPIYMLFVGKNLSDVYVPLLVFSLLVFIFLFATHVRHIELTRLDHSS